MMAKNVRHSFGIPAALLILALLLTLLPPAALAAGAAISLDKAVYLPGEEIIITVRGVTQQMKEKEAYISIYRAGAPHTDYMSWKRPETGDSQLRLNAPPELGAYEMRLYREDHKYTDDAFVMSIPFTVTIEKQGAILLEDSAYRTGQTIAVTVTGITREMEQAEAFVAIYAKGARHEEYGTYQYVRAGSSVVELTAPNQNGEFEMRLYGINHNYSDDSFVVSVPFTLSRAVEQPASGWAVAEIQKAAELGLIPDSLKNADLTRPITRAEFAAVSVKLYEKLSGQTAAPAATNPFRDTRDEEVLKAYRAGITAGVSADEFAPGVLLNREQAATMLARVFKRSFVQGWTLEGDGGFAFSHQMPPKFADDDKISGWARPSVYFMAAHGVISGVGGNNFAPKATTTAEQAANYASATREQALAISVRMTEKLGAADAGEIVPVPG